MTLPSSELQAWLRSQFPEGVPSWEVTADSLALLSSICRRHTRREEEAMLEEAEMIQGPSPPPSPPYLLNNSRNPPLCLYVSGIGMMHHNGLLQLG